MDATLRNAAITAPIVRDPRGDAHEKAPQQRSGRKRRRRTEHDTPEHELHPRTQDQADSRAGAAADADLLRAAAHGVDDDSVDAESGEQQSDDV